jgi:hypothetical protein
VTSDSSGDTYCAAMWIALNLGLRYALLVLGALALLRLIPG